MIKIPLNELKEFLRKAKPIKDNGIVPALAYLKLVCDGNVATITKNALSSFLIYELQKTEFESNTVLLIDFKVLSGFIAQAKGSTIEIELKGGKEVVITDGHYKVRHPYSDEKVFPVIQEMDSKTKKEINLDILESMNTAKGYVARNANKIWLDYVHVKPLGKKECCVFGSEGNAMYFKRFKNDLPEIILDPEVCAILAGMDSVMYTKTGQYHYFDTGRAIYGFSQVEQRSTTFEQLVSQLPEKMSFVAERAQIVDFCKLVISINPSLLTANCFIREAGKKQLLMQFVNDDFALGSEAFIAIEEKGPAIEEFWFNPKLMLLCLEGLPYEKICFYQHGPQQFFIKAKDDPEYVGIIRGMMTNPEAVAARAATESKK